MERKKPIQLSGLHKFVCFGQGKSCHGMDCKQPRLFSCSCWGCWRRTQLKGYSKLDPRFLPDCVCLSLNFVFHSPHSSELKIFLLFDLCFHPLFQLAWPCWVFSAFTGVFWVQDGRLVEIWGQKQGRKRYRERNDRMSVFFVQLLTLGQYLEDKLDF